MPLTMPEELPVVAINRFPLLQYPPAEASDKVIVLPELTVDEPVIEGGVPIKVTVAVSVAVNPFPSVMVTVYVVVDAGPEVSVVPVVAERPVAGAQV